jgi:energy-coupling factor transport system ATP-binding protein
MSEVALRKVRVVYPGGVVGLEVDWLEIEGPGLFLIAGRSGSGKSTLGKVVAGVIPRVERAEVAGEVGAPPRAAYLHQSPYDQVFSTYVIDEFLLARELSGSRRDVLEAAKLAGVDGLLGARTSELSGGQLQKALLGVALLLDFPLYVLDEPLAHLDPRSARELLGAVVKLKRDKTVLLIEHRLKEALQISRHIDKIVLLDGGRIVGIMRPEDVPAKAELLSRLGLRLPLSLKCSLRLGVPAADPLDPAPVERALELYRPRGGADEAGEAVVEVRGLHFSYGRGVVFAGADYAARSRAVYVLFGRNGSGKSTFLHILAGVLRPKRGLVRVAGRAAYVPQNPDLTLMHETVEKELLSRTRAWARSRAEAREFALKVADALGVRQLMGRNPHALSRGQRFRVALAAALSLRPRVLLLDEVTSGQDEESIEALGRALREFAREGNAVIIATHDVYFALDFADRASVVAGGRITEPRPVGDVLMDERLLEAGNLVAPPHLEICKRRGMLPVRERELCG